MAEEIEIKTQEQLREQFLRDLELGLRDAGFENVALDDKSESYLRANATANLVLNVEFQVQKASRNQSYLTATGKALDDIRIELGLPVVPAAGSGGQIVPSISGNTPVNFTATQEFTITKNGLRGRVNGAQTITPGEALNILMTDKGFATNAEPDEPIRFISPPNRVAVDGVVGQDGLTGGVDDESDARKRERIKNRLQNLPAGGNWAHLVELAESATGTVQKAVVFPALLGPGYQKVVVWKAMQLDRKKTRDFSREIGDSTLALVEDKVFANVPIPAETIIQSAANQAVNVAIQLTLPAPKDGGWIDSVPWPQLETSDAGRVRITTVTSNTQITINADTSTSPPIGNTLAWWSPLKREFVLAKITSASGSSGAWVVTVDRPLVFDDASVAPNDYVSPGSFGMKNYADAFLEEMNLLGCGENTDDVNYLPRAGRRPVSSKVWLPDLKAAQLKNVSVKFAEITDFAYSYRSSTTPSIPSDPADPPKILVLGQLGIYQL